MATTTRFEKKKRTQGSNVESRFPRMVQGITDTDLYKFTMGQVMFYKHQDLYGGYTFNCRNQDVEFSSEMLDEINAQIDLLCELRTTQEELDFLAKLDFIRPGFITFLKFWHPVRDYVNTSIDNNGKLIIDVYGPMYTVMQFEIYLLEIVNEVYFRMNYDYNMLRQSAKARLSRKITEFQIGIYDFKFGDFGTRRRLSFENLFEVVSRFASETKNLVGTSNVYIAMKLNLLPIGTFAHEYVQMWQGIHGIRPEYCNKYALQEWQDFYHGDNGTALTDTLGTDVFLLDFGRTMVNNFKGVRHDSGDPYEWGEKMIAHFEKFGVNPRTKTLLFSDSLDFDRAQRIFDYFNNRIQVSFGIGTFVSNDTNVNPLNIVIKLQWVNDGKVKRPVAKLSDVKGKTMSPDKGYIERLKEDIQVRLEAETA